MLFGQIPLSVVPFVVKSKCLKIKRPLTSDLRARVRQLMILLASTGNDFASAKAFRKRYIIYVYLRA